jgi:uncharacterized protein
VVKAIPVVPPPGRQLVTAYGAGGFRFGGVRFEGSCLIPAAEPLAWAPGRIEDVDPESLAPVLALAGQIGFLLLGTGPRPGRPPQAARDALAAAGIGLDAMDTAAACRVYNTLAAEGRAFAAGFIALP